MISDVFFLRGRNHRTISLRFSKQQSKILHATGGARAIVFGVIVDAGGNIEKQTRGQKLRIIS